MVIAVNTRFLIPNNLEGYGYFVKEVFYRLATTHPEHKFIFIFDRKPEADLQLPANVSIVVVKPKARHAISFLYWYNIAVPLAIKKFKPTVLMQPFGFCSLTTSIKQVLVIHDLSFLHYPKFIPKHHLLFYKWFTPLFIKKANKVLTVSNFSKQDIIQQYKTNAEKIDVVFSAAKPIFKPLSLEQKQEVKNSFATGREYFLFTGGIHPRKNLITVIKAFSIFKKWQHSNFKLLIAGRLAWQYDDITDKLDSYKYKDDVELLGYVDEDVLARLTSSAYCLLYPSYFEGFGVPVVEAMQSATPVITANNSSLPETGGNAALYVEANNIQDLAQNMIMLYKNETLRNQKIEQGLQQASKFSWEKTAQLVWKAVEETVQ